MSKSSDYDYWVRTFADHVDDIEVPTSREAEKADMVVCRLVTDPLLMPDNLVAPCSKCFRMVQFRPHAPKKPPKMCDHCARKVLDTTTDEVTYMATENTKDDVMRHIAKKGMH